MVFAQSGPPPIWTFLFFFFISVAIPIAFLTSIVTLALIALGQRRAQRTRRLAFGSLLLVVPAILGTILLFLISSSSPLVPSWNIMMFWFVALFYYCSDN